MLDYRHDVLGVRRAGWPLIPYARPAAVATVAAAFAGIVAVVDPNEPGHYPTCPFLEVTGLACPGCGSLRGVHALVHGDVARALSLNALMVAMVPILVWLWVRWVRRCGTGELPPRPAPAFVLWSFAALVVGFAVVRNLPFGATLAP